MRFICGFLLICSLLAGAELKICRTPENGSCGLNEPSVFTISWTELSAREISVVFSGNGVPEKVQLPVDAPTGSTVLTRTMNVPGSMVCEASAEGVKKAVSGTVFAADKIFAVSPKPADFDAFWKGELAKLDAFPAKAGMVLPPDQPKDVDVYDITIPCVDDVPVRGSLGIPKGSDRKWPVEITFHGAGVSGCRMLWKAKRLQRILVDINAHGIDNFKDAGYYAAQKKRFNGYPYWGIKSRDSIYFKNMILRAVQAIRFAKTLPGWDGKNLIISGCSQGGFQAIAAASLEPGASCVIALVPAVCDVNADLAGRMLSWPRFPADSQYHPVNSRVATTYIDPVNFAANLKVPYVLLSAGCLDTTSPAASVCAAFNVIPGGYKKLVIRPENGHEIPQELEKISENFLWQSVSRKK